MQCGKCGAQVGDDFKFCPECGTPMPVVRKAAEKALNQGEETLEKAKAEAGKDGMFLDSSVIAGPDPKVWNKVL